MIAPQTRLIRNQYWENEIRLKMAHKSCKSGPPWPYSNGDISICVHDVYRVSTCRPGRGISWRPPAYSLFSMPQQCSWIQSVPLCPEYVFLHVLDLLVLWSWCIRPVWESPWLLCGRAGVRIWNSIRMRITFRIQTGQDGDRNLSGRGPLSTDGRFS